MTDFSFCGKNVPLKMTNITLTCSTIGEYGGMSPQAQSKIYSKLPASWNCRIQGWLLRLHKSRKKEKNRSQQRLYSLEKFRMPPKIQIFFYRFTIDSLLSGSITSYCVSCTTEDLHKVLWTEWTTEVILPSLQDNHTRQSKTKAKKIITDPCHPNNSFFSLTHAVRKALQILGVNTERFWSSSYTQTIQTLNEDSARGLQH